MPILCKTTLCLVENIIYSRCFLSRFTLTTKKYFKLTVKRDKTKKQKNIHYINTEIIQKTTLLLLKMLRSAENYKVNKSFFRFFKAA